MEMLSLKTTKAKRPIIILKLFAYLAIPILLYSYPKSLFDNGIELCLSKNLFGKECIGCGMTRAIIEVLHFDFKDAYALNRLVVIVFPILAYIWLKATVKKFWEIRHECAKRSLPFLIG